MKQWFLKRGFSENKFDQEQGKVKSYKSSERNNKRKKGVCLVITYHQFLENINRIFHRLLDLLCTDQELETVFTPGPMALFRSARKSSSYLNVFFLRRGRRFHACLNLTETKRFTSASTNQTYKINHQFNCNKSSLI